MFLIDESPIGPCAVFMAPKTGATSLTIIAEKHNVGHRSILWERRDKDWPGDFHEMNWSIIEDRKVVITIRDPRERLLSLWKHYCNHTDNQELTLEGFVSIQGGLSRFFRFTMMDWYRHLMVCGYPVHYIRMESFQEGIKKHLGWEEHVHENTTNHLPWTDFHQEIEQYGWWKEDVKVFRYDCGLPQNLNT